MHTYWKRDIFAAQDINKLIIDSHILCPLEYEFYSVETKTKIQQLIAIFAFVCADGIYIELSREVLGVFCFENNAAN